MGRFWIGFVFLTTLGCGNRALQVTTNAVPLDLGASPRDGRLADVTAARCAPNLLTITTERTEYTLAEAEDVKVTVCNGFTAPVFVSACNPFVAERLESGKWIGADRACFTDHDTPLPPGVTPLAANFWSPGLWRIRVSGMLACKTDACAQVEGASAAVLVRGELSAEDCTLARKCVTTADVGSTRMCLAPDACTPSGIPTPRHCETDKDCALRGADFVCSETCNGGSDCAVRCRAESDCREGETCGADGHCGARACAAAADCPPNFACSPARRCARASCTGDTQCTGYCVEGACHELPGRCVDCCPP